MCFSKYVNLPNFNFNYFNCFKCYNEQRSVTWLYTKINSKRCPCLNSLKKLKMSSLKVIYVILAN